MHFIRLLLISLVALFLIITGISLLIPSHVRISKAIDIRAGKEVVLAQLADPAQWKSWYPGLDTAQLVIENGQVKGVAAKGSDAAIIITGQTPDEVITAFKGHKMKKVISGWKLIPAPGSNLVTVQWYMDFSLRWYPWEKFSSLVLEKNYRPVMEKGLANLKKKLEN